MVRHVPFVPCVKSYEQYYSSQAGHGLSVFAGGRHMKGRGLGSFLSGIGRAVAPLLKSGGKALLKQGLQTGMRVAQDVLSGQNFQTAVKQRAQQAGKRLLERAVSKVAAPPGEPARKRIKSHTKPRRRQTTSRGRPNDIFG